MVESYVREGGDITAADMVLPEEDPSEIVEFFRDSTILITGATGYLGKMFMEKLLRTCNPLKKIYILVRPKKGKEIQKRFEEIFEGPNMEPLKRKYPNFMEKVSIISGDCSLPDVGLDNADKQKMITEVNCIIHCAATVRFDEKLRSAAYINVRAIVDLLEMSKQMKNLKAFLYVSTAFCNCTRQTINEELYEPPITGLKLLSLIESLDDERLEQATPIILGKWPNTYVFTKAVAENVMQEIGNKLPVAVYRPSIVIASLTEPVAGWIDNFYGATGVLVGAALGLLRSLNGRRENIAEMVPADYVINGGIAIMWETAKAWSINENIQVQDPQTDKLEKDVPVYNYVSSVEARITWDLFTKLAEKHATKIPSVLQVWNYNFRMRPNRYHHLIAVFLLHTLPAYCVDFIAICIGKTPMMVKGYKKIDKFSDVIGYFALKEWYFQNGNVQALWQKLKHHDQILFPFSMKNFNWDDYFHIYSRGARVYLLKDPLDTIPKGAIKHIKLKIANYVLTAILYFILYKILRLIWSAIF